MLMPPLCHSCGRALGAYAAAYLREKQEKMKEVLKNHPTNIIPDMVTTSDELSPEMGDILDKMNFHKECCRQTLNTTVKFSEFY